jgi:hypothetical protein
LREKEKTNTGDRSENNPQPLDGQGKTGRRCLGKRAETPGNSRLSCVLDKANQIFSGLAWAIIFGVFASTAFTLVVIPVVHWLIYGRKAEEHERRFSS